MLLEDGKMASPKRKRRSWRQIRTAMLWGFLLLCALAVAAWSFYQFVINFDFEGYTPGTEPIQTFLPEGGYIKSLYPPYDPSATLAPTPMPTPRPTPIPLGKYSLLNKRMLIPDANRARIYADLTEFRISTADENRAFAVRGYGYLEGMDASNYDIYLVVSAKYGESHRFYRMTRESGCSGVLHPQERGKNLDQSDFSGCVRIEGTYASGEYRLGVLIAKGNAPDQALGYERLPLNYHFVVESGRITGMSNE